MLKAFFAPWQDLKRVMSNSFGPGGTNACLVFDNIEELAA